MNKLLKNSFFNILYTFLNVAFPMITSMYISRVLLAEGVGLVAYAQTTVSYFVTFANTGLGIYGLREIAKAQNDPEERNRVFTELFLFNAVTTSIAVAAYIFMIFTFDSFKNDLTLYICSGMLIAFQYMYLDWLYQGLEHYGYITLRSFIVKTASLISIILFVRTKQDYVIYALISSLAIGGNNIFNLIHSRKYVRFKKGINIKRHLTPVFFIAIVGYLSNIYNKIDITMLGALTTEKYVGYYSNAHRLIDIITMLCVAVSTVLMPRLSKLYESNKDEFQKLVNTGINVLLFIIIPVFSGVIILAPAAIDVFFGSSFSPAAQTIRVMSPMLLIKPLANLLCYQVMISTGNEKKRLPAFIAAAVVNIALNAVMIPLWQQNGAAAASVISELIINAIQLVVIVKIVKLRPDVSNIVKILSAAAVMIPVVIAVQIFVENQLLKLVIGMALGAAVYFGVSALLKNEFVVMVYNVFLAKLKKGK